MKKRFYVFSMLAAGMLLAGCSDDLEGGQDGPNVVEGETGYVKIALNLPSAPASNFRAANNNDDFDDGIEAEYAVNDVILALFYGTDETSATLGCAYSLAFEWTDDVDIDNVTRYISSVQEIKAPATGQNVYALAIVNGIKSGYFGVSTNNMLQFSASGSSPSDVGSSFTLASFYNAANTMNNMNLNLSKIANTNTSDEKKGNFLMLNAPISNMPSFAKGSNSSHAVTTLVPLNVYESKSAANQDANIDNIYVERAVAKVTVTGSSSVTIENDGTSYDGMAVKFGGWVLQNTNKKMYAVRNVYSIDASTAMPSQNKAWETWDGLYADSETNRFYGTAANPYRVYWGVDPNYFTEITNSEGSPNSLADNFNIWTDTSAPQYWLSVNTTNSSTPDAGYCAENTTLAADDRNNAVMLDNQLTSVLIKATLGDGEDVFLCGSNLSLLYTEDMFLQAATAALANSTIDGVPLAEGKKLALKSLGEGIEIDGSSSGQDKKTVADLLEIVDDAASASTTLAEEGGLSEAQQSAILTEFGNKISYYKNGVTYYYTSLIEHFGDNPTEYVGDPNKVEYNNDDHLGRYGVLRNNWYELNITSITGPGEPDIPEIPEEPADEQEKWIKTQINILSWAKREQNVDL